MTITLRACRRCGGDTNEREDIQAGVFTTCVQCGDVEYPGYVLEADKRVRVKECTAEGCTHERGVDLATNKMVLHASSSRLTRGYSPDSPEFHAPPYRIGYRA